MMVSCRQCNKHKETKERKREIQGEHAEKASKKTIDRKQIQMR